MVEGLTTILDIGLGLTGLFIAYKLANRPTPMPLPPGPRKWPIIGNLLDVPTEKEWLTFAKWGDLVSISIFGRRMIIVGSSEVAIELLEKRGASYSDRPTLQMGGEMIGWKNILSMLPYGERHKTYRRLFYQSIGNNASMSKFYPIEEDETHKFLKQLLSSPDGLSKHIRRTAGAIILHISHGYEVQGSNDPFIEVADIALEQFSLSTAPAKFLVNLIPSLSLVPDWFPGTRFKTIAREWAKKLEEMIEGPHQYVKDQMSSGSATSSFTSNLLKEPDITPEKEFEIKWSAGSLYAGGADTTVSSIYAFFKAMSLYPEVVAEAQAEIDSVVGTDRLPSFADREYLPYVNAIVSEVMRWNAVVPIPPHVAQEDDIYGGYSIPKGTLIIPNIWQMQHDPRVYSDPMTFNPKRFLGPNPEPAPRKICFGFGRRICPGRVLADASIFISCAMTLAVFDISKFIDESGQVIEPIMDQTTGTVRYDSSATAFNTVFDKALIQVTQRLSGVRSSQGL
ncbi:hypothetical protein NP233_g9121 [Leucocoprinus birnbaumii]|uniref:Cytochrome P450 n=1 Tax=Leucocoprinus birnbaumii TaxID=56174 RepID=A0AAD5VL48_9AGAR|nr:hypothetical protein NP233_g9121 [Leucocoprinus birnbaumii]